jgi:hypothetical protein
MLTTLCICNVRLQYKLESFDKQHTAQCALCTGTYSCRLCMPYMIQLIHLDDMLVTTYRYSRSSVFTQWHYRSYCWDVRGHHHHKHLLHRRQLHRLYVWKYAYANHHMHTWNLLTDFRCVLLPNFNLLNYTLLSDRKLQSLLPYAVRCALFLVLYMTLVAFVHSQRACLVLLCNSAQWWWLKLILLLYITLLYLHCIRYSHCCTAA